jgi:hypothetical protein
MIMEEQNGGVIINDDFDKGEETVVPIYIITKSQRLRLAEIRVY